MSRRLAPIVGLCLGLAGALGFVASPAGAAGTANRPGLLACDGKVVGEPANFVISCADDNSELTATHWSSWGPNQALGTTRFRLNLCKPYCAASKMSFFTGSKVVLSQPKTTRHGRLYSVMLVTYKLGGKTESFRMSWSGDPSF